MELHSALKLKLKQETKKDNSKKLLIFQLSKLSSAKIKKFHIVSKKVFLIFHKTEVLFILGNRTS